MSYVRFWVHLVWSTKNKEKTISDDLKENLINHIRANAKQKTIYIDTINCVTDHIHILLSLASDTTISKVVQLIKGESAFWVNKNKFTKLKFEWQNEYFASSVSESQIDKVRKYILNQEEHHKKVSFAEEFQVFLSKHGFNAEG